MVVATEELLLLIWQHLLHVEAHAVAFSQAIHFVCEGQRKLRGVEATAVLSERVIFRSALVSRVA